MMKIIAAAAFVAAPWQPAHAQAIVGSIPEECSTAAGTGAVYRPRDRSAARCVAM